jgi:hypothetical protein
MKFVTVHVIACMTRQDVERLIKRFAEEANDKVKNLRLQCDTISGRMSCEWEASDRLTLIEWLKRCNVQLRGGSEWIMQVQIEAVEGEIIRSS